MRPMRWLSLAAAVTAALAAVPEARAATHVLPCWLNAAQVVPVNTSTAVGSATIILNDVTGAISISGTHNVASPVAAHLHLAAPGVSGPSIFTLGSGMSPFSGSTTLSAAHVSAVLAGNTYLDIHSMAFVGGEIRGQVNPPLREFEFALEGGQCVPSASTPASGSCTIILHPITGATTISGAFAGLLGEAIQASLRLASPGSTGPPIVLLTENGGTSGTLSVFAWLSPADVTALVGGHTYVNVHSTAFPPGELRGQAAWACAADIAPAPVGDDAVNINDLLEVINHWGSCVAPCPPRCPADVSPVLPVAGDCQININDLLEVINHWGPCP